MKLGIYTDSHYSSHELTCGVRYNSQSLRKLREAYTHFATEACDLIVCLGDLIDKESTTDKVIENLSAVAEVIRSTAIPTVCVRGNHDAFELEEHDFYAILGITPPHDLHMDGKRLLFLDTCFFSDGSPYRKGDSDWTDTFYPHADRLAEELNAASEDVYLFLHQNLDPAAPENHRLSNADRLFRIINESGKVKAVFQGHYHAGCRSEYSGVPYITLPAMCENEGAYYIFTL